MTKTSVRHFALRVKEWWEAGPPRCLLRRVGLVPTSKSGTGALSFLERANVYGGPTGSHRRSIPTKAPLSGLGTAGSCSTFDLGSLRLSAVDRLLPGTDTDHIHTSRNVVKQEKSSSFSPCLREKVARCGFAECSRRSDKQPPIEICRQQGYAENDDEDCCHDQCCGDHGPGLHARLA
jgi:hypothetical protein